MGITSFCQRAARPRRRPCRIILLFYHRPSPSATGKEKRFAGAGGRRLSRYIADLIASAWVLIQPIEWLRTHKKKRAVCYQPSDGSLTEENSSAVQSLAAATASGFHTLIIIRFLPPVKGVCCLPFVSSGSSALSLQQAALRRSGGALTKARRGYAKADGLLIRPYRPPHHRTSCGGPLPTASCTSPYRGSSGRKRPSAPPSAARLRRDGGASPAGRSAGGADRADEGAAECGLTEQIAGRFVGTPSPSSSQAPHHSLPRRLESSFAPLLVLSPPKSLRWISAGPPYGPSPPFRGRSAGRAGLRAALRAASESTKRIVTR